MNLLKSVYVYLHDARLKEGYTSGSSPTTGNIVLACSLTMLIVSIALSTALLFPDVADWFDDTLKDIFGRSSGKTIGRLIGIALILLIYPILKFTVGTDESFYNAISEYEGMSDEDKEKTAKRGKWFFLTSICTIAIPFILGAIL
ncbi:MAG: hypothetical protein AAF502_24850 [Bacteroidota bacterium]